MSRFSWVYAPPSSPERRRTFHAVEASAPKNSARMSLSMPTTSSPRLAKWRGGFGARTHPRAGPEAGEGAGGFGADQTAGAGHQGDTHTTLHGIGGAREPREHNAPVRGRP